MHLRPAPDPLNEQKRLLHLSPAQLRAEKPRQLGTDPVITKHPWRQWPQAEAHYRKALEFAVEFGDEFNQGNIFGGY
jgi:hypothetical protein